MIDYTVDPNNAFVRVPQGRLVEACGIIPHFFGAAAADNRCGSATQAYNAMCEAYGFPAPLIKGAEVDQYGTYRYPGDEPLDPLLKMESGGVTMYVYQYAFVALVDKKQALVTRMD